MPQCRRILSRAAPAAWLAALLAGAAAHAQDRPTVVSPERLQRAANGVLSIMAYTLTPDVTTSSLSINDASSGSPQLSFTQFGGGFVVDRTYRVYLEGNAAYARYDPKFTFSDGKDERALPAKWNSVSGTGGVGWDFPVSSYWSLRPIFNFTLGYVASDLRAGQALINFKTGSDIDFIDGGTLRAYGLGGSLMARFEDYTPERELELEARYTNIRLQSYGGTSEAVKGSATAENFGVWSRMRVPTGLTMMQRPVRYVYELATSNYMDSGVRALGFNKLLSLGFGLELDSSAYDILVTRWRVVARHVVGNGVAGWSLGLAVSF